MDNNQASASESIAAKFPQISCSKHYSCKEFVQCKHCKKLMCKTSLKKHEEDVVKAEGEFDGYTTLNTCLMNLGANLANLRENVSKASQNVARIKKTVSERELKRLEELQEEEKTLLRKIRGFYKMKIHTECPSAKTISTYDQIVQSKTQEIEAIEDHVKNNATKKSLSGIFKRNLNQEFEDSLGVRLGESLDLMQDIVKDLEDAENVEEVELNNPDSKALEDLIKKLQDNKE